MNFVSFTSSLCKQFVTNLLLFHIREVVSVLEGTLLSYYEKIVKFRIIRFHYFCWWIFAEFINSFHYIIIFFPTYRLLNFILVCDIFVKNLCWFDYHWFSGWKTWNLRIEFLLYREIRWKVKILRDSNILEVFVVK